MKVKTLSLLVGSLVMAAWLSQRSAQAQLESSSGAVQLSLGVNSTAPWARSQEPVSPPIGEMVAFSSSAHNLVDGYNPDMHSNSSNVYLSKSPALMELVSVSVTGDFPGRVNGQDLTYGCYSPAMSRVSLAGHYAIAFVCDAEDIVQGYANPSQQLNPRQIYVRFYGPNGGTTTVLASGNYLDRSTRGSNSHNDQPTIAIESEDPLRYRVCFRSFASNLLGPGSVPNSFPGIFCESIDPAKATIVEGTVLAIKPNFQQGDGLNQPAISADGTHLAFSSSATVLSERPSNGFRQVYTFQFSSSNFELISFDSSGNVALGNSAQPSISADGTVIAFHYQPPSSGGTLLGLSGVGKPVFVGYATSKEPAEFRRINSNGAGEPSNGDSFGGQISANPRFAVFTDNGTNLLGAAGDNPQNVRHAYIKDLGTGEIGRADVTANGISGSASAGVNLEQYFARPVTIGRKNAEEQTFFVAFNSVASELATVGQPDASLPFMYAARFEVQADTPTPTPTPTVTPTSTETPTATPTATPDPNEGPPVTLTRNIPIESPPSVQIGDRRPDGTTDILIILRRFRINPKLFGRALSLGALTTSKGKITYHIELRKEGAKDRIKRVLSRNTTTIRKLTPGRYVLRYRVVATKGSKEVRSRQSPPANFTLT